MKSVWTWRIVEPRCREWHTRIGPGKIVVRFHGRDLHMVLGPANGMSVRFKGKRNDAAPGDDHGSDSRAGVAGEIGQPRMYPSIRQKGSIHDMTFEIEFLDPGVEAFSFRPASEVVSSVKGD